MNNDSIGLVAFGAAVLFAGVLATPALVNVGASVANRYDVEGVVAGEVHGKMRISTGKNGMSGTEKFSVPLMVGGTKRIINCTNTQCASLVDGDHVRFSCYWEWHVFTPSEEECRYAEMLP